MSLATTLHRAIAEIRDEYGHDDPWWNEVVDTLVAAYGEVAPITEDGGEA